MSYKDYLEDAMEDSKEARLEGQYGRPGIEVWPGDGDDLWVMRHTDPARAVICAAPEFGSTPFCGVGQH
jgi:hypothetical protein